MSSHEAKSWSVWCQTKDIEKVKKDQGRIENRESSLSSDHVINYIGTTSKKAQGD